jgi:hypothetical protein
MRLETKNTSALCAAYARAAAVIAALFFCAAAAGAADTDLKLNSTDGSTRLEVQNSAGTPVFTADSAGNTYAVGYSSALRFYGDGSTLGNVSTGTYKIGDSYGGGKIFWVDAAGRNALIAGPDNLGPAQWGPQAVIGATLSNVYGGKSNTLNISTAVPGASAARLCAEYALTAGGEYYDDWYLPSYNELQKLYAQKEVIGGFLSNYYWSSTESGMINAYATLFGNGTGGAQNRTGSYYVRCIRGGPGLGNLPRNFESYSGGVYLASTQTFTGLNTFGAAGAATLTVTAPAIIPKTSTAAANAGINLTSADFGKVIMVNSGTAQAVNLPSVTAADIGATITVAKLGGGRVTVQAAGSAYIEHSPANGALYCNVAGGATVTLRLAAADRWVRVSGTPGWEIY